MEGEKYVIVLAGMIGAGKTTYTKYISEYFNSEAFYESVDDNPILEKFYDDKVRWGFALQVHFLNTRFKSIKKALIHQNNVLDRSIYEDWYFAKKNMELGRISELEMNTYEGLLENMLEELKELPKKSPDIMVYLKGSFETVMKRINLRGRDFEVDESLKEYYHFLWQDYDNWVNNHYNASEVLIIDMDTMDVVNNEADKHKFIEMVEEKLKEVRNKNDGE